MADPLDLEQQAARATALHAGVFAAPNVLRAESLGSLESALRWHRQGHGDRPILLPFKATADELISWYACAPTGAMARALSSELVAFLGPSYIQTASPERVPDAADAHMLPLVAAFGWQSIRFSAAAVKDEAIVQQQWQRLWRLLERRPTAAAHVPQTFDQVRAAFDRSLAALNEPAARVALVALRERFGLSAENRLFLDVRLAAAFRRWDEVAGHRLLHTMVHLQLPPETYGDVMEALYEAEVAPFEGAPRLEELLSRFRETMAESARPLFRTRRTSRRPAVLKAFVLYELIQPEPHAQACAGLLKQLESGAFGGLDAAVRAHAAGLEAGDQLRIAQQAIALEQFDRAYDLLWPLADDVPVFQGLVLCAREAEDPLKADAVMTRLVMALAPLREAVEHWAPVRLQRLRALAAKHPQQQANATFAAQLGQRVGESSSEYVDRWRELARATPPDRVFEDPAIPAVAAECLTRLVLEQSDLFVRLHPLWHELFVDRLDPDQRLIPVYVALLETLRARGSFSETDRGLLRQTLTALVMAGPAPDVYRLAVDEVHEVFKDVRSPHTIAWALDVCDGLAIAPARDLDARMRLLLSVRQAAVDYRSRLSPMERGLLKLLLVEAGVEVPSNLEEAVASDDEASTSASVAGRLVAFYSLDEAAIKRATQLLRELFPQVKVESSADTVCTQRLKSLAQHADVFVFAWKSSKHAAYDCVKAAVRDKDRLVMARGAGTSSLVDAALQQLH
jgi:hypothetical protein